MSGSWASATLSYQTVDPRSEMLKTVARGLGGDLVELAIAVEQTVVDVLAELKPGRRLYANVEYYAGVVMSLCGVPPEMFTADLRLEPSDRLERQRPRAGERSEDHSPERPLRRPARASAGAGAGIGMGSASGRCPPGLRTLQLNASIRNDPGGQVEAETHW